MKELLPQSGRMRLLERILEHTPERTSCTVDPASSELFAEPDGSVPATLGLEYMAQCAAVHGGLLARARGETPRPALLLGCRRLRLAVDRFPAGRGLLVSARHHRGESGLVAFDCEVRDARGGEPLAEGRLNVYTLDGRRPFGR